MAREANQKLKVLYLLDLFEKKTDEHNAITVKDMIAYLERIGISAERKAIYTDLDALREYGMDIISYKQKGKCYYYLASREFEIPELKLLIDAVLSSRFITLKKSNGLIKKIKTLASEYEAKNLQRQLFVDNRIKMMNESIYYNIDGIYESINNDKKISFKYAKWIIESEVNLRKDGERYTVSPWSLAYSDNNYYLIAYDSEAGRIKHFRVDKMLKIEVLDEKRDGWEIYKDFDVSLHEKRTFSMYSGSLETVRLKCCEEMLGVMIDRFGPDSCIMPSVDDAYEIRVEVEVSKQFLSWVIGLGDGVKITSPENVVEMMRKEGERIVNQYKMEEKSC